MLRPVATFTAAMQFRRPVETWRRFQLQRAKRLQANEHLMPLANKSRRP
jgi:hypothetical protein